MTIYPDLPYVRARGDGGPRSTTQMVVIHATDNTASDEDEAAYAARRADMTSAHFFADADSVIQAVDTADVAYGCYPQGNARSVQFELCGLSGHVSDVVMRRSAPIVRRVCDQYAIPIRKIGPADLRAGTRGICGHVDVTAAWGEGDHTDPGANFDWPRFLTYVASATGDDDMQLTDTVHLNQSDGVKYASPTMSVEGVLSSTSHYVMVVRNQLAAMAGKVDGLVAAVGALSAGTGMSPEALQALVQSATEAGVREVLGSLDEQPQA